MSESTIPKQDNTLWKYPTTDQFRKAVHTKHPTRYMDKDYDLMVQLHNKINDRTWLMIKQYEQSISNLNNQPKLINFRGCKKLTIRSWFNHYIRGWVKPFDTHYWLVDRNGKQVCYIIDYYNGRSNSNGVYLDIRPNIFTLNGLTSYIHKFINSFNQK